MQLYALDGKNNFVAASKALKQQNYICLECEGIVRVRSGIHRHAHFFHLKPSISFCKLHAKSMVHLQVQWYLQAILPKGECFLERPFAMINRIADAAWLPQKLIFEVQCSPISAHEVKARIADYASIGFQVIWILHERQFNQFRMCAAELALRSHPFFFTDIDLEGKGTIYDQFDLFKKGLRVRKLKRLEVDLSHPFPMPVRVDIPMPMMLQERMKTWSLHFSGDLIDHAKRGSDFLLEAITVEDEVFPKSNRKCFFSICREWILKGLNLYKLFFRMLLERACK